MNQELWNPDTLLDACDVHQTVKFDIFTILQGITDCSSMATCVNGEGFYDCECNTGFFGDGYGASGCSNIDECAAEINVCFEENTYCMDSVGSQSCKTNL